MAETTSSNPSDLESDPFLRLHKMSTTAGLGSGDYVAINTASLAALLLGIASCLVLWGSLLLLIIPLIGLICSIIAIQQVAHSNGTQTGRGLAVLGLLLCLGMGGGYAGHVVLESVRNSKEQDQVVALLEEFGALIRDNKYEQAYDLFDDHFRSRVPEAHFIDVWKQANGSAFRGPITGATSNGLLKFEDDPLTGQRHGAGVMLLGFTKIPAKERQNIIFAQDPDRWRIDQLPDSFPVDTGTSGAPGAPKKGGFIGPPAPTK